MTIRETLTANIANFEKMLADAKAELYNFDTLPENNSFTDLDEATATIEEKLLGEASADCEGSYNCGQENYTQEFIVNGQHYLGTLTVEYNRHDKTYYYVDGHEFTFAETQAA